MALTEKQIPTLEVGRHTDSRGLYLLVGKTTKTWQFKRRGRWVRIGTWPAWTGAAARERARELTVQDDQGRPLGQTLKDAYERWLAMKVPRSPLTVSWHGRTFRNHFADWHGRDLTRISRTDLDHRHAQIVRKAGPMAARNAVIAFQAWWRQARRVDPMLPECPSAAVELHPQRKKDASDLYNRLGEWHGALDLIRSPVRKELYLFGLFTGLRRDDLRTMRWEHVRGDVLHVPSPKRARGEQPSSFDLPLTEAHTTILSRLRPMATGPWVFPGLSGGEELRNVRLSAAEAKDWAARGAPEFTTHDLRRCFITAAVEAGVHPYAISLLVNHRIAGVASHYVARGLDLRAEMGRVAGVLSKRLSPATMAACPPRGLGDLAEH